MIRTAVAIALLVASSASAASITRETVTSGGKERSYYLFVPDGEQSKPLVMLLHGSGRNGKILLEHWRAVAEKEGIVLVGPDANISQSWSAPIDGPDFLRDVIEAVKARAAIDDRRMYLFGHSAGGMFALQMMLLESNYFAAVAVHAALLRPDDYGVIPLADRKIPVMLIVGSDDPGYAVKDVQATHDVLAKAGHPMQMLTIPRHTHDYYSKSKYVNAKAWEFLRANSLEAAPQYKTWLVPR
jgi:poly(3-hydroxybutyrate) depolymerase